MVTSEETSRSPLLCQRSQHAEVTVEPVTSAVPQDFSSGSVQSPQVFVEVQNTTNRQLPNQTTISTPYHVQQPQLGLGTDLLGRTSQLSTFPLTAVTVNPVLVGYPSAVITGIPVVNPSPYPAVQAVLPPYSDSLLLGNAALPQRVNFIAAQHPRSVTIPNTNTLIPLTALQAPYFSPNGATPIVTSPSFAGAAESLMLHSQTPMNTFSPQRYFVKPPTTIPVTTIHVNAGQVTTNTSASMPLEKPDNAAPDDRGQGLKDSFFFTGVAKTFPMRLHRALAELEVIEGGTAIAAFLPHGRSFFIKDQKKFVATVLPKFFPKMKGYPSFQRQLNLYDFQRIGGAGPDRGSYYHEFFTRDNRALSKRMRPLKIARGPAFYSGKKYTARSAQQKAATDNASSSENDDDSTAQAQNDDTDDEESQSTDSAQPHLIEQHT